MSADAAPPRYAVVHLSTVHRSSDIRIYRKECTALHDAGVRVAYVSRGPAPEGDVPWIELQLPTGRLARMLGGPWRAWGMLRRLRPQVLHIHDPEMIPVAWLWKRRTAGRVVYDAHEDLPKQVAGKPYLPRWSRPVVAGFARVLESIAERHFDAIVCATPPIARNFPGARRLELVQNFPWLRDYPQPTPITGPAAATACYVGGLTRGRGSRVMAEAIERTRSQLSLRVAGRKDRDAAADLETLGDRLIDHGEVEPAEVPRIIAEAGIGLALLDPLPNYLESQPTKLFEYMAAGRPFIASDFPYWRQLVERFDCGLFVDPDDSAAVVDALERLADHPERAREMGARGRDALLANFTFEREATNLVRLFDELVARR